MRIKEPEDEVQRQTAQTFRRRAETKKALEQLVSHILSLRRTRTRSPRAKGWFGVGSVVAFVYRHRTSGCVGERKSTSDDARCSTLRTLGHCGDFGEWPRMESLGFVACSCGESSFDEPRLENIVYSLLQPVCRGG